MSSLRPNKKMEEKLFLLFTSKFNNPTMNDRISVTLLIFLVSHLPSILVAQQPYVGLTTTDCYNFDTASVSSLGYFCNGLNRSCQSYLTFRAQPPYDSVSTISTLLGVDPSHLARLNSVRANAVFQTQRIVLVPVACSCSGPYYQTNRTYVVRQGDTYLRIANNTFQGLSTCQALQKENSNISAENLIPGERITVPLRCACPTKNQTDDGVKYLLSYLVDWSTTRVTTVLSISSMFGVDVEKMLSANGLSDKHDVIYPFTTLLVPLHDPPTSVEVTAPLPPSPPSEIQSPPVSPPGEGWGGGGGSSKTWIYALVGAIGGLVLVVIVGLVAYRLFLQRRKRTKPETVLSSEKFESAEKPMKQEDEPKALNSEDDWSESISTITQSLKVYTFEELRIATEDFDPSFSIKGSVYRGVINGDYAAIKKMNGDVSKEITLLNKINHFNLICLSGVCFNKGHWYLVYEYASNGSLDDCIHSDDEDKKKSINWSTRLRIASDIANGLTYLHCYTNPPCIHKDLNSSNVLLDQDLRAKISNFGLARFTEGQDGQFAMTRHIVGTKGYMAPEYLENGLVSPKLDVYAFGVLMLEILTGKEVSVLLEEVNGNMPLSEVLEPVIHRDGDAHDSLRYLIDPSLQGCYNHDQALEVCRLIHHCLKKNPSDRPNMDEVSKSLSRILGSASSG